MFAPRLFAPRLFAPRYFPPGVGDAPEPEPEIEAPPFVGRGSGPTSGIQQPGYTRQRDMDLEETRRKRILREDDDIVALVAAMLSKGLL